ncbi:MAG: acetoin dehydrogenase dihydrolipoyllysine-residue acetyltransferase subunit [Acidimicrobiia bacterium]|nr:acetoin dehydrogenase dihydrolipoyllysine-residue acetyltransferase subunit [Acidimicrobiia bacterium]
MVDQESSIVPIVMPKWGLSMTEGEIVEWMTSEGEEVDAGDDIVDVETDKIAGTAEAPAAGTIRRIVGEAGRSYPVGALLAVMADPSVDDSAIDRFVAEFVAPEPEEVGEEAAALYSLARVGEVNVRYSRVGEGPAVVLLHGFGGDLDNWLFNLDSLAESNEVVALDLPGHGQSSLAISDPSIDGLASFVWSFLDAIGVGTAALIGHSMGGAVAAHMTGRQPDRVSGLVLIAPAGLGAEINQSYIDGFVTARSKREMKAVAPLLFADDAHVGPKLIEGLLRYKRMDGVIPLLSGLRDVWFTGGTQHVDVVADLSVKPTAVIWGEQDQIIPADHASAADGIASVNVVTNAGHMVQMEQPREVNEIITGHLASL